MIFHLSFGNGLYTHNVRIQGFNGAFTGEVAEGLGRRYLRLMQAWYGREFSWWHRMYCPVEMPSQWRSGSNDLGKDCKSESGKQMSGCQPLTSLWKIVRSAALVTSRFSQA